MNKLNIGCGDHPLAGWLNVDEVPVAGAFKMDATQPFPFEDGRFDRVFSEHMIEHVPYLGGFSMLRECFRVLKPGGRIRISTPCLEFLFELMGPLNVTQKAYIEWAAGIFCLSQPAEPELVINNFVRAWGHQFIWSRTLLPRTLIEIGFKNCTFMRLQQSYDSAFRSLENDTRMPKGFLQLETMTLEAERP